MQAAKNIALLVLHAHIEQNNKPVNWIQKLFDKLIHDSPSIKFSLKIFLQKHQLQKNGKQFKSQVAWKMILAKDLQNVTLINNTLIQLNENIASSNFITNMLCQLNLPEHATNTDDVTHRMLGWQTDIHIWIY